MGTCADARPRRAVQKYGDEFGGEEHGLSASSTQCNLYYSFTC